MSQLSRMIREGRERSRQGEAVSAAGETAIWRALSSDRRPESLNVFSDAKEGPDFEHEDRPVQIRLSGFDRDRQVRILCARFEPRVGDFLITLHDPPAGRDQKDLIARGAFSERAAYRVEDVDPSHRPEFVEVRAVMDRSGLN